MTDGLHLDGLEVRQGAASMLAIDALIGPGQILTVMGPSGAGKSTLLDAVIGTLAAPFTLSGHVRLGGADVTRLPPERRRIGILYQDPLLFPHLSIAENLAFGLAPSVKGRAARAAAVEAALAEVDLDGFGARDPATLSGGQKARIALMRTLLAEPRALLLDEPFARLDADLRDRVRRMVFARARARGLPVLLVTHDPGDAEAAAGSVLRIG